MTAAESGPAPERDPDLQNPATHEPEAPPDGRDTNEVADEKATIESPSERDAG